MKFYYGCSTCLKYWELLKVAEQSIKRGRFLKSIPRSLAAADVDGDGNVDVAIGAPGFSHKENIMAGRAYILYSE